MSFFPIIEQIKNDLSKTKGVSLKRAEMAKVAKTKTPKTKKTKTKKAKTKTKKTTTVVDLKPVEQVASPVVVDTKPKKTKKTKKTKTKKVNSDPSMWASHQTHQFATSQLESVYKFTRERLIELMVRCYNEKDGERMEANVVSVLGKKPIKIKKIRDPAKPSKPLTGYQLFCRSYKYENKPSSLIDLSREQSSRWKTLSVEDKEEYLKEANHLKQVYKKELEAYESKFKIISKVV